MWLTQLTLPLFLALTPLSAEEQEGTADETVEGIEILRRLLVEEVEETAVDADRLKRKRTGQVKSGRGSGGFTLAPEVYVSTDNLATTFWGSSRVVKHSRGFHLPGSGAYITLDVELPVSEVEPPAEDEDPVAQVDDEWERMKRNVRTGADGRTSSSGVGLYGRLREAHESEWTIDPPSIDAVRDAVLRTLARHAPRVQGLGSADSVTVLVHLHGADGAPWYVYSSDDEEDPDSNGRVSVLSTWASAVGARRAADQHMVLQVGVSELQRLEPNGGDVSALVQRARINLY